MPELEPLFTEARTGMHRLVQGQITISRDMRERNLSVRVTTEQSTDEHHGYVVTLDDITDLVTAQRTSAWADIARRIAHEIKNPLTPIQLSAERLKRKYGKVITEDKAVFEQCTDTIVRQVDDIKRMVDEFSRFARMPKPVIDGRGRRRHRAAGRVPAARRLRPAGLPGPARSPATAVAPTAAEAEARAKAAPLAGPEEGRAWLTHGGAIVADDGAVWTAPVRSRPRHDGRPDRRSRQRMVVRLPRGGSLANEVTA